MTTKTLINFLKWVDMNTYMLDGERYFESNNNKTSYTELANMFFKINNIEI